MWSLPGGNRSWRINTGWYSPSLHSPSSDNRIRRAMSLPYAASVVNHNETWVAQTLDRWSDLGQNPRLQVQLFFGVLWALLVAPRVAGPICCISTMIMGISAILPVAMFSLNILTWRPLVMTREPLSAAPMQKPIAAIYPSDWIAVPPTTGSSWTIRNKIDVAGVDG